MPRLAEATIDGPVMAVAVAISVVTALIGAGLMLKSAWRLTAHPAGFEPARILMTKIELSNA